jgi:hypothetical protein
LGREEFLRGRCVGKGHRRGCRRLLVNNQVLTGDVAPPSVEVNAEVARDPEQPGVQSPLGRIERPTASVYATEEDFGDNVLGIGFVGYPPPTVAEESPVVTLEEGVQGPPLEQFLLRLTVSTYCQPKQIVVG